MGSVFPNLPPGYRFDVAAGRYRDSRGRFVATKTLYQLMGAMETANADVLRKLALALADKQIPGPAWYMATAQQLQRLHVQYAALGAGGVDRLTSQQFAIIDRSIRDEMSRLLRFGVEIMGGALSPAQISARIDMYIGTARKHYWAFQALPKIKPDETIIERRRLGVAEHCELCTYLANAGWQPVGVLPLPGESVPAWTDGQCLSNCRCELERRVVSYLEAKQMLEGSLPPQYRRR